MQKRFMKLLFHHPMYLGEGGIGHKIRLVKLKKQKYESLVKSGVTNMNLIEIKGDCVIVSVSSTSYEKFTHYHKFD